MEGRVPPSQSFHLCDTGNRHSGLNPDATGIPGRFSTATAGTSEIGQFAATQIPFSVDSDDVRALANSFFESGVIFGIGAISHYFWIVLGMVTAISRKNLLGEPETSVDASRV